MSPTSQPAPLYSAIAGFVVYFIWRKPGCSRASRHAEMHVG